MTTALNIAIAQLNLTVGDIDGNLTKLSTHLGKAKNNRADLVVFPELAITGYLPEDMLFRDAFMQETFEALQSLALLCNDIDAVVGVPVMHDGKRMNAAAHLSNGKITGYYFKQVLPNYGVFDEKRYFSEGKDSYLFTVKGHRIALAICEDIWTPAVCQQAAERDPHLLITLNASPFEIDKTEERFNVVQTRIKENDFPIIYTNCIGGQDELVFDGGSFALNHSSELALQMPYFKESMAYLEFDGHALHATQAKNTQDTSRIAKIYDALVLGIKDYVHKNHFPGAIIGLSGGIDSAVTLALACSALGNETVQTIMMPSRYTSQMSVDDATQMAARLQIDHLDIDIEPCYQALLASVDEQLKKYPASTAKENLQARSRGVILMALSNASGKIVLTTGNRSEMAVGYATLYGDMAGGFAVLKDLPKTVVYELADYINREQEIIPQRIIDRPPSAELSDDQKDEDSLPPYEVLDQIIALHIDKEKDLEAIVAEGFDQEVTEKIIRLIRLAEYKRRQAPPGIRINHRAFGRDRRYPITSGA
jgi:NAD+ synthase (glutamine-hydrolysing)